MIIDDGVFYSFRSVRERVASSKLRKQLKISISGKQLFNTVSEAQGSNSSVVYDWPTNSRLLHQLYKQGRKVFSFAKQRQVRGVNPGFNLSACLGGR